MSRKLNLIQENDGGDFMLHVRYDARTHLFLNKLENGDLVEIKEFRAAFDLKNLITGWARIVELTGPSFIKDVAVGHAGPPVEGHRRACKFHLWAQSLGGLREMLCLSKALNKGIEALYAEWEDQQDGQRPGMIPLVYVEGFEKIESRIPGGGTATNHQPVFKIERWVKRPDGLPDVEPASSKPRGNGSHDPDTGEAYEADTRAAASRVKPKTQAELDDEIPF